MSGEPVIETEANASPTDPCPVPDFGDAATELEMQLDARALDATDALVHPALAGTAAPPKFADATELDLDFEANAVADQLLAPVAIHSFEETPGPVAPQPAPPPETSSPPPLPPMAKPIDTASAVAVPPPPRAAPPPTPRLRTPSPPPQDRAPRIYRFGPADPVSAPVGPVAPPRVSVAPRGPRVRRVFLYLLAGAVTVGVLIVAVLDRVGTS